MVDSSARRTSRRDILIRCATEAIAAGGLGALRARDLAARAGCSVGAIYNLVADLDELALRVAQRTLAALDAALGTAGTPAEPDTLALLLAWARAYAAFAAENRNLWRALFELRLPEGRDLPSWFADDQLRVFARLEAALLPLMPDSERDDVRRRARTLFSAVHGIVAIGLEQKLVEMPPSAMDVELDAFVRIFVKGLTR